MRESLFVWHDEADGHDGGATAAAGPMNDAEIDEHSTVDTAPAGGGDAPSDASIQAALARFGHTSLRGLQGPALRSVFAGHDTVVLLPTGGGKSLCFQLPAVMKPGLVVVISPLLALMQDQVVALRRRGVRVEMLCSLVSAKDKRAVHERLLRDASFPHRTDRVEILYTTPETLPTESLQATLQALERRRQLALFAIDEAHCISSWGHDFRPSYLKLGAIRDTFPDVPIMALTATATDRVRADIRRELQLREGATTELLGDFNRPNISYSVHNKDTMGDDVGALLRFIQRCHRGSVGIIYVHRRLDTEALVEALQARDDSICAAPYHAEIPLKQREQTLLDWLKGRISIICATIAFGMGIDHPAVRFVVHWNMPKSMENLYQEAGRAGRDGHASHHVLLYSYDDYARFQDLLRLAEDELLAKERSGKRTNKKRVVTLRDRLEKLEKVMQYATHKTCRRRRMLTYFGQEMTAAQCSGTCDHCNDELLFEKLPRLASHRPEANTYHLKPGEAPYKWKRPTREIARSAGDDDRLLPTEAVPRYRGATWDDMPPRIELKRSASPSVSRPVSPPRRRPAGPSVPAGVQTIGDYIAATAHRRTAALHEWIPTAPRRYHQDHDKSDSDQDDDDDVQWIDPSQAKRQAPQPLVRSPKRRRTDAEIIVIDDDSSSE